METQQGVETGNFKAYLLAFIGSIILTLAAYFITVNHLFTTWLLNSAIALLAFAQAWIQLVIFLNLGRETKPRWNFLVFFFTIMVTVILVFGSLWIMYHLNYNLMATS